MRSTLKLVFCFFFIFILNSQGQNAVILEYDYLKQEVSSLAYVNEKSDTVVTKSSFIRIKESVPIQVIVKNINTEALQVKTAIKNNEKVVSQSSGSLRGFLSAFTTIVNPAMGIDLTSLIGKRGGESNLKAKEFAGLYPDFFSLNANSAENLILKYDALVRERLTLVSEWKGIANGVKSLRYDTRRTKNDILKQAEILIKTIDQDAPELFGNQIKLDQVADNIAAENTSYLQMVMKQYAREIKILDIENIQNANSNVLEIALANFAVYEQQVSTDLSPEIYNILKSIGKDYQVIQANPYETSFNFTLEEEASELEISVLQKILESDSISNVPILSKIVSIKGPVGLGLANSIGMNFIRFANTQKDYYLSEDDKVLESNGDVVLPTLAVMVNFYRPSQKSTKIGGHFAIGVPLSEDKNIHYLLGPSIILGRNNTVILNLGVNVGKANRLGNGLKTGDIFTSSDIIPISSKFSLGYQFGMSFNLSELISK